MAATGISADIAVYPGGSTYSAAVVVTNTGTQPTTNWEVDVQLNNGVLVGQPSNATFTQSGTVLTLRPLAASNNFVLAPGAKAYPGFSGKWNSSPYANPTIIAVRRDVGSSGSGGASSGGASTGGKATGGAATGGAATGGKATGSAGSGNAVATSGGSGGSSGNNVAQDKTATASSSLSGNPASYGNDASATTSWCAFSPAVYEWWSVDLGANYALTGTEVTWPQSGRIYQYFVSISSDGTNYSEVVNQRSNARTMQTQADSFTAQGRYLRLQVTGLTTSPVTSACISDFKAFGTPVASSGGGGATGTGTNIGGATGSSTGGATTSSGGTLASGGTTGTTSSAGTTSGGASSSGGTSSSTAGGTTSVPTDRRTFTIRLPGGVRRQDAAVATDGGPLNIADNTQVLHADGSYSSVTGMAMPDGSRIGVEAHVLNAWVDGNIQLANRTVVDSYAKATGNISREPDTKVTAANVFELYHFTPPEVIHWDVDFPLNPTASASLGIGQTLNVAPGGYDVGYAPRDAHLRLAAGTYTFNRITIEDGGFVEVDNSAGPVFVYIRDFFAFRGRIDRTLAKANVLFGVAGTNAVSLERAFKGILVAPNAPVTLTSTVEHRGAFFGKGVSVLQNVTLVHEPFEPSNFCEVGAACSDFCPCGGDTCGESSCTGSRACGTNQGRRFGRASGISVCMDPGCSGGTAPCGEVTDTCGLCGRGLLPCESDSDCVSGDTCGKSNGSRFGLDANTNVCLSAVCQAAPNIPPNCGGKDAACGACDCSAACATKACGDDRSDGCGGNCTGFCENGLAGCKADGDCPEGSVCGIQVGARFGFDSGANVCWPASCSMQDPSKPNAGVDTIACGVSPACTPICEPDYTGPDGCGGFCGDCQTGEIRTSFGYCSPLVLNVWKSLWDTPSAFSISSAKSTTSADASSTSTIGLPPVTAPIGLPSGTSWVGALAGSFAVSDRGEAEYEIPIAVPPGRLGLQPTLSLSYRSNKTDGALGLGWAIGGLSSISRCPQIYDRDGKSTAVKFDADDRFCLDGQALIWVSDNLTGATYRLEGDPTVMITMMKRFGAGSKYLGPNTFRVQTEDGRLLVYGGGDDTTAVIVTGSNVRRVWALSLVEDRSHNRMSISYRKQTLVGLALGNADSTGKIPDEVDAVGELLPDVIAYGGNAYVFGESTHSRFIKFNYEARPDPVLHFMWGVAGFSKLRLSNIETYVSDVPARKYVVAYRTDGPGGASLVGSVTEWGILGSGTGGVCKPATTFEYEQGGGWGPPVDMFENAVSTANRTLVLDVDGDGRDDVLKYSTTSPSCELWVSRVGSTTPSIHLHAGAESPVCVALAQTGKLSDPKVLDVNRDGKDDIFTPLPAPGGSTLRSTGNVLGSFNSAFEGSIQPGAFAMLDVDGNGFRDIRDCTTNVVKTRLNDGTEFVVDESRSIPKDTSEAANCRGSALDLFHSGTEVIWDGDISLDLNGDGHPDSIDLGTDNEIYYLGASIGAGGKDYGAMWRLRGTAQNYEPYDRRNFIAVDANGDTLQELLFPEGSVRWDRANLRIVRDASMTTPFSTCGRLHQEIRGGVLIGDFDGDGAPDLLNTGDPAILYATDCTKDAVQYSLGLNTSRAGLLKRVTDGFGRRTTIAYDQFHGGSATDPVYSPGDCFHEARKTSKCLKTVGPVVSSHSEEQVSDTLINPGPSYKYYYSEARRGVGGRNWLVFKKRNITTPLWQTEIEYHTDDDAALAGFGDKSFLIVGKVKKTTTTTTIGQPANTYSTALANQVQIQTNVYAAGPSPGSGATFAYLYSKGTINYENGQLLSGNLWRANTVDEFGFTTLEETDVFGSSQTSQTTVQRGVTNDKTNWRIGQVDSERVTSLTWSSGGSDSSTREVNYGYDALGRLNFAVREPNGRVDQSIPGAGSNPYLRTRFSLDQFGNVEKIEQYDSPSDDKGRRVFFVSAWAPQHFWPAETEDALGHKSTMSVAAATGQLLSSTDANGAVSNFRYDDFGRPSYADTPQGISTTTYSAGTVSQQILPVWGALIVRTNSQGAGFSVKIYDAFGRVVRKMGLGIDAAVDQAFEYDDLGRLVRETRPHKVFAGFPYYHDESEGIVTYGYFGPRRALTTLPDGNAIRYYYTNRYSAVGATAAAGFGDSDATTGTIVVNPRGNVSVTVTDPSGNPILRGTGGAAETTDVKYSYGAFGAPRLVSGPGGLTSIVTDVLGRPESLSDPATGMSRTVFNGYGEAIRKTDGNGTTTYSDHDALGRLTEVRDHSGATIAEWTYDGLNPNEQGRLVASYRQSAGQPGTGVWQTFKYQPEPYSATSRGMLQSVTYGVGGTAAKPGSGESFTIAYEYGDPGAAWRRTSAIYPSAGTEQFAVDLHYTESGVLGAISNPVTTARYWELLATDQGMRPTLERFGNGVEASYDYHHLTASAPQCAGSANSSCMPGLLRSISVQQPGSTAATPYLQQTYEYDGNENLRTKSADGTLHQYTYDMQERLLEDRAEQTSSGTSVVSVDSFTYDAAGNLKSKTGLGNYTYYPNGTYDPVRVHLAGGVEYVWDGAGNLLWRSGTSVPGTTQRFDYDDLNLPYRVSGSTSAGSPTDTEFDYDANGARVVKRTLTGLAGDRRTTNVVLDIGEMYQQVREYDPSTGTTVLSKEHHYRVFAGAKQVVEIVKLEDAPGHIDTANVSTTYLHQDHLGSGVLATDTDGNVRYQQEFDAFGAKKSGGWKYDATNSGFTGHQHDNDLDLINMRGRLYDARLGRFTRADPFVTDPMSAGGLNRYSYVRNNPLNMADPSGFETINPQLPLWLPPTLTGDGGGGGSNSQSGDGGSNTGTGPNGGTASDCPSCGTPAVSNRDILRRNPWNGRGGSSENYHFKQERASGRLSLAPPSEAAQGVVASSQGGATSGRGVHLGQEGGQGDPKQNPYVAQMTPMERFVLTLPLQMCLSTAGFNLVKTGWQFVFAARGVLALPAPAGVNAWVGEILSTTAAEDLTMYRVWGGGAEQVGSWLSPRMPESIAAARASLALPAENAATFVSEVIVPAGTRFQIGQAASAFGWPGGGLQVQLLERIPISSYGPGVTLFW